MSSAAEHDPDARRSTWSDQRVLITGATGFIGAALVKTLVAARADVHVLVRPDSSTTRLRDHLDDAVLHVCDLRDLPTLGRLAAAVKPSVIFHLATHRGTSPSDRMNYVQTSVIGAAHLIEVLRTLAGCRLVVAGSSLEYGGRDRPLTELDPLAPTTLHGVVKAAASLLFRHAAHAERLAISQLRIFHVYGPGEPRHRFLPTAIRLARAGQPVPLVEGVSRRDWIHVDDVVRALILAATPSSPTGEFNIGSGVEHTNEEVLGVLETVLQRRVETLPDRLPRRPTDEPHRCADRTKALEKLRWSPHHDIASGVRHTVLHLDPHPDSKTAGEATSTRVW